MEGFGGVIDLVCCRFGGKPLGVFLVEIGIWYKVLLYFLNLRRCYVVLDTELMEYKGLLCGVW